MANHVQLTGMDELRRRIGRLERKLQRRVYTKAVREGGKVVQREVKERAPRRTGAMARAVSVRASSKAARNLFGVKVSVRSGVFSSARTAKRKGKGATYKPDEVVRYYRFLELGTKHHPAQPFLAPALERRGAEVMRVVGEELRAGVEREAKGL